MRDKVEASEERLRCAMLAGDVEALSELLDDNMRYVDPAGSIYSKADDIAMHRSRRLEVTSIDPVGTRSIETWDDSAIVCVTVDLAGLFDGAAFFGRFTYSRLWRRRGASWKVVHAHCSAVPAST